jgi:hypothetical protein
MIALRGARLRIQTGSSNTKRRAAPRALFAGIKTP